MSNSVSPFSILFKTLLVFVVVVIFGCTKPEPEAKSDLPISDLPAIVLDQQHNGVDPDSRKPRKKFSIYELKGPVKVFYFDTGSFSFDKYTDYKPSDDARKVIQVVISPSPENPGDKKEMKFSHMAFDKNQSKYKIELEQPVNSGDNLMIALGWEYNKNEKIEMKFLWVGSARVN